TNGSSIFVSCPLNGICRHPSGTNGSGRAIGAHGTLNKTEVSLCREGAMQSNLGRACRLALAGRLLALTTILAGATGVLFTSARAEEDDHFVQTNLVSDLGGVAKITDPALKNPWGLSHSPTSPFWTSNQGTSTATLYAVTNKTTVAKVNI